MDWLIFCIIITIVIRHAVNHSYNLSLFSINMKMFSLFLHILCSKKRGGGGGGGRHLFSSRKQILVGVRCWLISNKIYSTLWSAECLEEWGVKRVRGDKNYACC